MPDENVMDHRRVGRMWDENAPAWTELARAGYDVYRDYVNTPAFLEMLPRVSGLRGLDIGCGEGHNTRLVAARGPSRRIRARAGGARMTAIDVSKTFVAQARTLEAAEPLGIQYVTASAVELPFPDGAFDFAVATMSLMDIPEQDAAVREAYRVLAPGGFFQFSILHPCFSTRRWKWVRDENGERIGVVCGDYYDPPQGEVQEWIFGAAPPEAREGLRNFRIPKFFKTLSGWMNSIIDAGFRLERFCEPCADEETARACPDVADTRHVAFFLHVRCRKPG